MIQVKDAQLFEERLSLYGREYSLAVYVMLSQTNEIITDALLMELK